MVRWAEYMPNGDPPIIPGFIPPIGGCIIILLLLHQGAIKARKAILFRHHARIRQSHHEFLPLQNDFYYSTSWVAETNPVEGNARDADWLHSIHPIQINKNNQKGGIAHLPLDRYNLQQISRHSHGKHLCAPNVKTRHCDKTMTR
jgi:hypothetical protein